MSVGSLTEPIGEVHHGVRRLLAVDCLEPVHELDHRLHPGQMRALIHRRDQDQLTRRRRPASDSDSTSDRATSAPIEWATIDHGRSSFTLAANRQPVPGEARTRFVETSIERIIIDNDPVTRLLEPGDHVNETS